VKLNVQGLTKTYLVHPVLNVNEATFGDAGIEGLIGPNGAGKSTLMGLLTRRIKPTSGEIVFSESNGQTHQLNHLRAFEVARLGLIKSNQKIQGFDSLTIRDSLRLAATNHLDESIKSIFSTNRKAAEIEREIDDYLSIFNFSDPDGFALSSGEKKLLDILRCLMLKPKLLLLDEPTAGLPEDTTQQIMKLLQSKVDKRVLNVVIVEHDLELIWKYCSYVHFLADGEMLFQGTPEEVKENRVVAEKYMGV